MPKFIEQILEMLELNQEFEEIEIEIPMFFDGEFEPNIEDTYIPENIL